MVSKIALLSMLWLQVCAFRRRAHKVSHPTDAWSPVREQLDSWIFTENFAVVVGNSSGTQFSYTHGNFTTHTQVETASTSKWPIAMMFVGLVNDGSFSSLDVLAHEYIPWWSSDQQKDVRANVTLRHLLSFTSGFGSGSPGQENSTTTCMDNSTLPDFEACAKEIYDTTNVTGTPGETFSYNSIHLQLAGAMAVRATGLSIQEIVAKYLFKPYKMYETTCGSGQPNPQLAVCLQTTAHDYAKFLSNTLTHSVLKSELVEESEKDYTPFMRSFYNLYGVYSFGHFLECFDSVDGFTKACADAQIHCDPGAFGFYPLIDRKHGYYMQIVAYETNEFYPRSGIPEYLRLLIKPLIDAVMLQDGESDEFHMAHHTKQFNALSMVDINYIAGCYVNPETCA